MSPLSVVGAGTFLTSGDTVRLARQSSLPALAEIAEMHACGLRWACIWVRSYDGRALDDDDAARVATRLRTGGVEASGWTFPHPDHAARAGEQLARVSRLVRAQLAILDYEDPDGKGPIDWSDEQVDTCSDLVVDGVDEHTLPAITSYPMRRGFGLPWTRPSMKIGAGMPQIYETADDPAAARAALERWREAHGLLIPVTSLRTPGRKESTSPEQFAQRLETIAPEGTPAWGTWCWTLLRSMPEHRAALLEHARRRGLA